MTTIRPYTAKMARVHGQRWPGFFYTRSEKYWVGVVSLGNMTRLEVAIILKGRQILVGVIGFGCYWFEIGSWVHWDYLARKMAFGESDARNLADFLNSILIHTDQEQGIYDDYYCAPEDD